MSTSQLKVYPRKKNLTTTIQRKSVLPRRREYAHTVIYDLKSLPLIFHRYGKRKQKANLRGYSRRITGTKTNARRPHFGNHTLAPYCRSSSESSVPHVHRRRGPLPAFRQTRGISCPRRFCIYRIGDLSHTHRRGTPRKKQGHPATTKQKTDPKITRQRLYPASVPRIARSTPGGPRRFPHARTPPHAG